ncbi:MAG: hypothetical protein C0483_10290 [Pirellula sp.]|nr:hypothetical protein [Pirellula sp.]
MTCAAVIRGCFFELALLFVLDFFVMSSCGFGRWKSFLGVRTLSRNQQPAGAYCREFIYCESRRRRRMGNRERPVPRHEASIVVDVLQTEYVPDLVSQRPFRGNRTDYRGRLSRRMGRTSRNGTAHSGINSQAYEINRDFIWLDVVSMRE